jgi:hypothetical protein
MRALFVLIFLLAANDSTMGQTGTPFVSGVPSETEKSNTANTLDPLGAWKDSDVELPNVTKSLAGGSGPSVHNLSIPVADGLLILSQLWDASCTTSECPTQIYLLKKDGTKETKLEPTMLPQITPADGSVSIKGVGGPPTIFLSPDGKSVTANSEEHGFVEYKLK